MFFKKKKQEDQDILKQIKDKIAENDNDTTDKIINARSTNNMQI